MRAAVLEEFAKPLQVTELDLANGQGATETWVADENTVQRVLDQSGGFGADELYLDGQINIDPFLSRTITLDDVNHGFELPPLGRPREVGPAQTAAG